MDFMANGLLALGASPAMVHAVEELESAPCPCLLPKLQTKRLTAFVVFSESSQLGEFFFLLVCDELCSHSLVSKARKDSVFNFTCVCPHHLRT